MCTSLEDQWNEGRWSEGQEGRINHHKCVFSDAAAAWTAGMKMQIEPSCLPVQLLLKSIWIPVRGFYETAPYLCVFIWHSLPGLAEAAISWNVVLRANKILGIQEVVASTVSLRYARNTQFLKQKHEKNASISVLTSTLKYLSQPQPCE